MYCVVVAGRCARAAAGREARASAFAGPRHQRHVPDVHRARQLLSTDTLYQEVSNRVLPCWHNLGSQSIVLHLSEMILIEPPGCHFQSIVLSSNFHDYLPMPNLRSNPSKEVGGIELVDYSETNKQASKQTSGQVKVYLLNMLA